ncbi:MAG: DUF1573 domain-containing protein [Nitrospiraceae bacterium]|nr:DUF1573 domain-containing protein [Nitrospiraceae bacterium]
MKHRSARRLFIIVVAIAALAVIAGVVRVATRDEGRQSEVDFLRGISEEAYGTRGSVADAWLPPVQEDGDLVPVIEVEPPELLDVGVIPNDRPYETEILVRNTGRALLEISQIDTSCGACTRPTLDPKDKRVRPGGTVKVKVGIYPSGIPSFYSSKTVTIMSNDAKHPAWKVEVVARVDPEFLLEPAEVDFGTIAKGTPATRTILFRQLDQQRVEVEGFEQSKLGDALDLSFEMRPETQWLDPDRTEYDLYISLPEDVSPGKLTTRIYVKTTCKRVQRFPVVVRARVESFYSVVPTRPIMIRRGYAGKAPTGGSATIKADRSFELTDLRVSIDGLAVTPGPGEEPNSMILSVEPQEGLDFGAKTAKISFNVQAGNEVYKDHLDVLLMGGVTPST